MDVLLSPIGWVKSSERGPREDFWGEVVSEIALDRACFRRRHWTVSPSSLMLRSCFICMGSKRVQSCPGEGIPEAM